MKQIARQIHEYLTTAKKAVVVAHQNADADAIGSAGAMAEYLADHGLNVRLFCFTPVGNGLNFLPHSQHFVTDPAVFADVDTVVVVDSGDLRYAGVEKFLTGHPASIVNIDHHATNEKYGHYNMVMPGASSTAEVLFRYFRHNNIPMNRAMSTSLLAGLVSDTDNFSNPATSASALLMAGELLRRGGDLTLINRWLIKNKTINSLKLWGDALSRLAVAKTAVCDITHTYITRADMEKYRLDEGEAEGIANFLTNLESSGVSLILKETADGKIKGSFRTASDDFDVSLLAKRLGGGGHKKAAGFTAEGAIEEVLKRILTLG